MHESAEQRWEHGQAALKKGKMAAFTKMMYSRVFFTNGDGDYQSRRELHNGLPGLSIEDLDDSTAIAVRMKRTRSHHHIRRRVYF
ncbi:hypothetical protein MAP00_005998 [Monascus purpureus]|nr:hypothetical protein MAP00_005998 [Monascus purpureus]